MRNISIRLFVRWPMPLALLLAGGLGPRGVAAEAGVPGWTEADFRERVKPWVDRHCLGCHSAAKSKGDLDLERFKTLAEAAQEPKVWQGVLDQVQQGEMPPKDEPQPSAEERERLLTGVRELLRGLALARAGDPGPVVLRRLSNAEYTYTVRDLTGVETLDPAREFPVDGAAGEGFMNTGQSLVMSPALLDKYLAAARDLAAHAVLTPEGFRFSPSTSRRDWTDEIVGRIREVYRQYTDGRGATRVQLQGLEWETNEGGRVPLERYLRATLTARSRGGETAIPEVARESGLSPRYLARLWSVLNATDPSPVLDPLRRAWRDGAGAGGDPVPRWVEALGRWQKALWKFSSVGHIGKVGGPSAWMEPVTPLVERQEFRLKTPGTNGVVTVRLGVSDAGDGPDGDRVIWQRPRWSGPGRPDLLVRDVRAVVRDLTAGRERLVASVAACLDAAAEVEAAAESGGTAGDAASVAALAARHGVDAELLEAWLEYLGWGAGGAVNLTGHLAGRLEKVGGFDFVAGWGQSETPLLLVNRGDRAVRIPGHLPADAVAVHPSPSHEVVVAWRSPVPARVRIGATVRHAHPECGNGVSWVLELRRGPTRRRLAQGTAQGDKVSTARVAEEWTVRVGDVVALRVGPRDGNHACDLTLVDLDIVSVSGPAAGGGGESVWRLSADLVADGAAANPHADRLGHEGVWHAVVEPVVSGGDPGLAIPPDSVLARWRWERDGVRRGELARAVERLLRDPAEGSVSAADAALRRQVLALGGPLFRARLARLVGSPDRGGAASDEGGFGLGAGEFGGTAESVDLRRRAGEVVEFRVPADLVEGMDFVTAGVLEEGAGEEGTVQLRVGVDGVGGAGVAEGMDPGLPVVVRAGSGARRRIEAAWAAFREVFPAALAYVRIVPVDEVVTLTLFHREDEALRRLMLDEAETARLDRLWEELRFVSQDALALVDAFAQLMEYATQDADPKVFEPLRGPIHERAARLRAALVEAEPRQVEALVAFAGRAYRRPLESGEAEGLRALYGRLRSEGLAHEDALRTMVARVLVSPAFLYKPEKPGSGSEPMPVSGTELANRLSYFLWSSMPDEELSRLAASGRLLDPDVLAAQARRMLKDERVRRLATEFGCQWLHVHGFDTLDEKSERHFPTFAAVRGAMYEESIRFFTDFFQSDRRVRELIDGDYVFVNGPLAAHYGIEGVTGEAWRRVDGARALGRGGILALASTLAKQSGASRTSPILRGNWLSEVVLGERLPRPPKDVPRLPEDEASTEGWTVRALVERHSVDPRCAGCHVRIDPYGFALEGYDAIGRRRERDLADRPVETRAKAADGAEFDGLGGLREYVLGRRGEAFERQFCRKLLGYALGREVMISDQPLVDAMRADLARGGDRVGAAVETVVRSRQFREIRGRDMGDGG